MIYAFYIKFTKIHVLVYIYVYSSIYMYIVVYMRICYHS